MMPISGSDWARRLPPSSRVLFFIAALLAACAAQVRDAPRSAVLSDSHYRWRGVSLDVARHFFSPLTIRRFIDLAAHYKLNVVHLHLTDNEAWRLPSRVYPLLPSPLHYTGTQLRDLDLYARSRGVVLVPEIDVPSHSAAAIRAYPGLACGSADTLCPAAAQRFAGAAIAEASTLFSGGYVHTGGDEVQGWSLAQRRAFEHALDALVKRTHKTMVVWDDEADAAPADAIVEVWHLNDVRAGAAPGRRIIWASDGPLYFDAVQGAASQEPPGSPYMSTLEEVYEFSAPPHAFGIEAALWTEHIASDTRLWYMLLPREAAFSAVARNAKRKALWSAFRDGSLPDELRWLSNRGYTFRVPNTLVSLAGSSVRYASVPGNQDASIAFVRERRISVSLRALVPKARIRYRTSEQMRWRLYGGPFVMNVTGGARVDAQTTLPDGRAGAVTSLLLRPSSHPHGSRAFDDVVSP